MKKVLAAVLVLTLLIGCSTKGMVSIAEEQNEFEPKLTSILKYTSSEWIENSYNRAVLAVLLSFDFWNAFGDSKNFQIDSTAAMMVGREGFTLIVIVQGENAALSLIYVPITGKATYTFFNVGGATISASRLLDAAKQSGMSNCYIVDIEDYMQVVEDLLFMLN